ncbi:hypothetical protein F7725_028802 [Dissostichus mawsoni]|uniref:Uncharacterized protein n=1 Tax=Dissostichus mawsoni TaxID=36200 RepID=A0A7J5XGT5_DISMA|nr:hypothetical protein F7725_028802 [Dissostichus mawsoni]
MQYQKLQQQMEEEFGALEEKVKRKTQAAGGDTAPASITVKTAQAVLQLIHAPISEEDVGVVHTGKRTLTLGAEQVTTVYVNVNTGAQYHGQDLLLVPSEEPTLPEGVVIEEGLVSVPRKRQHQTGEPEEDSDSESSDEVELVCRFPYDQELSQRAADLNPEAEPFAPALTMQDGAPDLEDATVAQKTETDNRGITADGDGENGTAEPGESLQESSEEDDPDPPPATSYPGTVPES